jgi:two-component system, LuxR family, response regulator FixJ
MSSDDARLVYVVDDDDAVRDSLKLLLKSVDLPSRSFASAGEFLESYDADVPSCLVADIRMPGMSGLELQEELVRRKAGLPIIFVTGHGDVPMAVKAMKAGAMDFLQKPFRDQDLLDRVYRALQQDKDKRRSRQEARKAQRCLESLTPRETEVMDKVVRGQANKVIAQDLGVSQRTVELHRARVMHKMGVRSLAELVRLVGAAKQL